MVECIGQMVLTEHAKDGAKAIIVKTEPAPSQKNEKK